MRALLFLPTLFLLAVVPPAIAAPQLSLTWDTCVGPIDKTAVDPGVYTLNASLTGLDVPTKAYQVWISYGDAALQVPDAWRFDAFGCQTEANISINNLPSPAISKVCPALQGTVPSLQIKTTDLWPPVFNVPTTLMRSLLANAYPEGNPVVDPSTHWFLAGFRFDHTYSIVGPTVDPNSYCGGFETSICFRVQIASYLTLDDVDHPIDGIGAVVATFNGGAGCGPVPARPSTWGDIKAQYRR